MSAQDHLDFARGLGPGQGVFEMRPRPGEVDGVEGRDAAEERVTVGCVTVSAERSTHLEIGLCGVLCPGSSSGVQVVLDTP